MSRPGLVSVVTATYQRADTLPRLWDSLLEQGDAAIEWVVVDDGSDDGTEALVRAWEREAPFAVRYSWQSNQGKHAAVNRGVELAAGEFCAVMDSDDWYAPGAITRMLEQWEAIPPERRDGFANVEGLCADPAGEVIGDRLPQPVLDSNTFEIQAVHGVGGDKIGMYRRDVMLDHPFPEDLGWHVTAALVWNRIAARYSTRFVDEIWAYKEYLPGGITDRDNVLHLEYPAAQLLFWREFAAMPRPMPWRTRLRAHAQTVRYSLHEGESRRELLARSSSPPMTLLAWPVGKLVSVRDRARLRAAGRVEA